MTHVDHHIIDRFAVHDFGALFIDHLALVVHNVVVLDDLFADLIVPRLDLLLGGLDRLGKPLGPDGFAVFQVRVHHLGKQRVRTEDA